MTDPCLIVAEDARFRLLLAAVQRAEQAGAWADVERLRERLKQAEHEILMELVNIMR